MRYKGKQRLRLPLLPMVVLCSLLYLAVLMPAYPHHTLPPYNSNMTNQADGAIEFALAQVGKPYVFGAAGPNSYDCSGLVMAAYRTVGVTLPHSTFLMVNLGKAVSAAELAPGDLIFPEAGHVQMYLGNGNIVEAPTTGIPVRVVKQWGGVWRARRIAQEPGTGKAFSSPASPSTPHSQAPSGGISNPLSGITDALAAIGRVLTFISSPGNWLRLAEFIAGIALVLFSVYQFSKDVT